MYLCYQSEPDNKAKEAVDPYKYHPVSGFVQRSRKHVHKRREKRFHTSKLKYRNSKQKLADISMYVWYAKVL